MKYSFSIMLILAVVLGTAVAPSAGQATFVFEASDGYWRVQENWNPQGRPGPNDTAVIPSARTCRIDSAEACANLTITGTSPTSRSKVVIEAGHSLTINGGEGNFETGILELDGTALSPAVLKISGEVLITGDVSEILMSYGLIDDNGGGSDELTIDIPYDPGGLFGIIGDGEIEVALVNKAIVGAIHEGKALILSGGAKEGTQGSSSVVPTWQATGGGSLQVDVEVTGEGWWIVGPAGSDNDDSAIVIGVCCDELTADVSVKRGTFKVEDTFCTTGRLLWVPLTGGSTPTIHVDAGASATFAGPCPTECD